MERKIKVFVVGTETHYASFIYNYELVDDVNSADIVIFTGGEDVDPSFYGAEKHETTWSNIRRDIKEKAVFDSIPTDKLVIGICRGSQFLCVMNGGLLVQHCTNHGIFGTHGISNGDKVLEITSTHHQMQYPYNLSNKDYDLLYTAYPRRSRIYCGDKVITDQIFSNGEPEIVLYHTDGKPKCLAIQGHPEMMDEESITIVELNKLIKSLL